MLIDSKSKMIFNDYNPEKRTCQYKPCSAIGKHKACGECKYVRYCSPACQRLDWKVHKQVCATIHSPMVDASVWREEYEWVFRWAATHALQAHWNRTIIRSHILLVHVLHDDRLLGTGTPSHFEVSKVEVLSHEQTKRRMNGAFNNDPRDLARCIEIQNEGGLGMALVLFCFPPPLIVGDKGRWIYFHERYEMIERRDRRCKRLEGGIREVEEGVQGFINGIPLESVKDGERSAAITKTSTIDHSKTPGLRKWQSKRKARQSEQEDEEETMEVEVPVQIEEVE